MTAEQINSYIKVAHDIAKEKGFWDDPPSEYQSIMLMVSELGEAVEAHRKNKKSVNKNGFDALSGTLSFTDCFETYVKDTFEDEIADIMIRLFDFLGFYEIEFEEYVNDSYADDNIFSSLYYLCSCLIEMEDQNMYFVKGVIKQCKLIAKLMDFDLEWHIEMKMRYNQGREYKHGKAY